MPKFDDIADLTVDEVLAKVGDDPAAAEAAAQAEHARGDKARKTLLEKLAAVFVAAVRDSVFAIVDGGGESLKIPAGASVASVTDRTTGRVLDPGDYKVVDGAVVRTAGGSWARGVRRWAVDFEG